MWLCHSTGMFKDPDFQSAQAVDKRGRKVRRPCTSTWGTCTKFLALPCSKGLASVGQTIARGSCAAAQVKRTKAKDDMRKYYRLHGEVQNLDCTSAAATRSVKITSCCMPVISGCNMILC